MYRNKWLFGRDQADGYSQFEGMYDGTTAYIAMQDAHSDTTDLINATTLANHKYQYDAYGNEVVSSAGVSNPFRYCSQYYDEETGLYYLRARYYDPSNGRFTQQDSYLGEESNPLTLNLYQYCWGNPVGNWDLSGMISEVVIGIGILILIVAVALLASFAFALVNTHTYGNLALKSYEYPWANGNNITLFPKKHNIKNFIDFFPTPIPKTKKKDNKKQKIAQYWKAELKNKVVKIGSELSYSEARARASKPEDVMCATQSAAVAIIKFFRGAVGPERHGTEGFYWHYHIHRKLHKHIWYLKK